MKKTTCTIINIIIVIIVAATTGHSLGKMKKHKKSQGIISESDRLKIKQEIAKRKDRNIELQKQNDTWKKMIREIEDLEKSSLSAKRKKQKMKEILNKLILFNKECSKKDETFEKSIL